jgi:hypothetical protein
MTLYRLMNQNLTVQTVGGSTLDAYGNVIPVLLGTPVATVGYLEQSTTTEYLTGRQTTITTWQAYLPDEAVIHPMDFITYQGQRFQVDGEPWHVFNPRTSAVSHIQVKLTEVT